MSCSVSLISVFSILVIPSIRERRNLGLEQGCDRQERSGMAKTLLEISLRICGTCAYRRSPVCLSLKLVQACARIGQNPDSVNEGTLNMLIRETEALGRRKYKCDKEPRAWIHLVDKACAFWQPREQRGVSQ